MLIYTTVLVAIIVIPLHLGGYGGLFSKIPPAHLLLSKARIDNWGQYSAYGSLALGSAMSLFLYPHAVTGLLSSNSDQVIKRNAMALPAFTVLLGLLALVGFMAVAAGVAHDPAFAAGFKTYGTSYAVPAVLMKSFPDWFVGFAFAGIAIGALVPAGVMAIGSANIIARDVWGEVERSLDLEVDEARETRIAKVFAVLMVIAGLAFVIVLPLTYVIQFQLIGGVWVLQTFPAIALSLYMRHLFSGWGLFIGWLAGMVTGTWMVAQLHFAGTAYPLHLFGASIPFYAALAGLVVNIVVSVLATLGLKSLKLGGPEDQDAVLPTDAS